MHRFANSTRQGAVEPSSIASTPATSLLIGTMSSVWTGLNGCFGVLLRLLLLLLLRLLLLLLLTINLPNTPKFR